MANSENWVKVKAGGGPSKQPQETKEWVKVKAGGGPTSVPASEVKPTTAESERKVRSADDITFWQRVGAIGKGTAKSYGSGFTAAAGTTADLMSEAQRKASDVEQQEWRDRYQRSVDDWSAKLASAKTDEERAKFQERLDKAQKQLASFETNYHRAGLEDQSAAAAKKFNETADNLSQSAAVDIERAKTDLGFGGQALIDLGVAGGQLAGDIGLGVLTGGGALIPMAARSFGSGAQQARKEGASLGQQVAYGAGTAALSVGLEKLSNFAKPLSKAFGAGFADEVITKLGGKLAATAAGRTVLSALGEGFEEGLETLLDPLLQRVTYDKDAKITADTLAEAGYNALIGGALGGLLGAGGEIASARSGDNAPSAESSVESAANTAETSMETPAAERAAEAIVEGERAVAEDAMADALVESVAPSAKQVNAIAKDPAALERLGIDPNGKTASQIRAEVRDALNANAEQVTEAPVAQTPVQTTQESTQPSVKDAVDNVNANVDAAERIATAYAGEDTASVGAAPEGFDPITHLQFEYGTIPPGYNAARPGDLPRSVDGKTKVSYAARSMKEAKATPESRVATIEQNVLDGKYSDVAGVNKKQIRNASARIRKNGWSTSVANWMEKIDQGIITADTVAEGALIYTTAANSDLSDADFTNISVAYAKMLRQTSQATQAGIILKKLSPQSRLYAIEREVAKMNEALTKEGEDGPKIPGYTGIPTWLWMDRVGQRLSSRLAATVTSTEVEEKAKNVSQIIYEDLYAIAMRGTPLGEEMRQRRKANKPPTRKYIERLFDLFQNEEKYQEARGVAFNTLLDNFGEDPEIMDALESWLETELDPIALISKELTKRADIRLPEGLIQQYIDANTDEEIAIAKEGVDEFVKRHTPHDTGLAASAWMDKAGEQLAAKLVNAISVKNEKAKNTSQQILDDLYHFAMNDTALGEEVSEKRKYYKSDRKRSEIDRLSDLFRNPDKYREAWNSARNTVLDKYGDDVDMMAALDSWMNSYLDEVQSLTRELTGRVDVRIEPALAREYLQAETEEARDAVLDKIIKSVAADSHATIAEKFHALLYTAMLGNFKTVERNTLGNFAMKPIRAVHNAIATGLERLAGTDRTRSAFVSKDLVDAAKRYYEENRTVREDALGEQKYARKSVESDFARRVNEQKPIFEFAPLEGIRKGVNWAMNDAPLISDQAFNKSAYARALAGWLKANNVTAEQFSSPEWRAENAETVDKAHAFSAKEAQEATFRNNSELASLMVKLGNMNENDVQKWFSRIFRGIQPFLKTPANVMTTAVQYSPLGFIGAATSGAKKSAYKGGKINEAAHKVGEMAEGTKVDRFVAEIVGLIDAAGKDISGAEIVNSIAKASTGSMLMLLGMLLRNAGILRGGEDDDEKQTAYDELVGHQQYAIETPSGKSVTIGWVAPASVPLFMGAELIDQIQENGFQLSDVGSAITSIAEPLLTLSMTQGFSDALNDLQYSDGNNLMQLAAASALDRLLQIIPTVGGHLERVFEDENTMTYVDRDSDVPAWMQRALGQASRKFPGLDYNQIPYIDAWGRTEERGDALTRSFNSLINPAYTSTVEMSEMEKELQRLYDATGEGTVLPSRADKSFKVDKKDYNLSADEYVKYATVKGQTSYQYMTEAVKSSAYRRMSDKERVDLIGKLYQYANYKAKRAAVKAYANNDFAKVEAAEKAGISPVAFYTVKASDANGNDYLDKTEARTGIAKAGIGNAKGDMLMEILFPKK